MRKTKLFTLGLFVVVSLQLFAGDLTSLKVPSREIPLPYHAEVSVQEFIAGNPTRDVEDIKNIPMPKTVDEWKKFVAEFNKTSIQQGIELAEKLGVIYENDIINGVEVFTVTPPHIASKYSNNLFIHIHGGAFLFGGEEAALREAARIAYHLQIPVISIDYRKAPAHPAPAAVNDIVAVWSHLITERPAATMMMGGSSAGGNLTTASAMRIRDLGLPLPAGLFIGTPVVTLLNTPDSRFIMEGIDHNLGTWDNFLDATVREYYGNLDPKGPYLSPIYGTFEEFPPSLLVTGTRDLLLSDTVLLHRAIRGAGREADLHVYEGHSHGGYVIPGKDMANFFEELDKFAKKHLKSHNRFRRGKLAAPMDFNDLMMNEHR